MPLQDFPVFTSLKSTAFENIVGKGENAGYQHFLLFPQYFQRVFPLLSVHSGLYCKGLILMFCKKESFCNESQC